MTLPILLLVAALSFALGAFASAQIACWSLKAREDKLAADRRRLNALRHTPSRSGREW